MWRTLRALFAPGKLTKEYFAGRRGLYLRTVRLFLVVNVVFFLVLVPLGGQGFRGGADLYRAEPALAAQMDRASADAGLLRVAYDAAFDQRADTLSRTLIGVLVPLLALVFAIVLFPARASAARHVVFASHFVVAMMGVTLGIAVTLFLAWILWTAVLRRPPFAVGDAVLVPAMVIALAVYLVFGIRRVYVVPGWVSRRGRSRHRDGGDGGRAPALPPAPVLRDAVDTRRARLKRNRPAGGRHQRGGGEGRGRPTRRRWTRPPARGPRPRTSSCAASAS